VSQRVFDRKLFGPQPTTGAANHQALCLWIYIYYLYFTGDILRFCSGCSKSRETQFALTTNKVQDASSLVQNRRLQHRLGFNSLLCGKQMVRTVTFIYHLPFITSKVSNCLGRRHFASRPGESGSLVRDDTQSGLHFQLPDTFWWRQIDRFHYLNLRLTK